MNLVESNWTCKATHDGDIEVNVHFYKC